MTRARASAGILALAALAGACRQAPRPDISTKAPDTQIEQRQTALTALSRTGWTASASTTGGTDVAANAIDGNATTRWRAGAAQATNQWFQVDMASLRTFAEIRLDTTGTSTDFPRNYRVQVANDNVSWGTAPNVATGMGTSAVTTIAFAPRTARFVRVTLTAANAAFWSIHEFNVYGTALSRTGWTATASSTNGTNFAANALDGSTATRWSSAGAQTGQWFKVDMKSLRTFNQIILDAGTTTNNFPRGYSVVVSNDDVTWSAPVATGTGTTAFIVVTFATQYARYIRIDQTATNSTTWSIQELNVEGQPTTAVAQPRAGWIPTASSTNGTNVATNALDGNTTTRWTSAGAQTGQSFRVDMLTPRLFNQITLDAGTSTINFPRGYQVDISNDATNWTTVASGTNTSVLLTINLTPARTARHIRINQTATNTNPWSIQEMNVTGQALSRTGWVAAASSNSTGNVPANAIDGSATTRWSTAAAQTGQTYTVDMGTAQVFNQLTLDAGTTPNNFPRTYSVFVSSDGVNFGSAIVSGTGASQLVTINFANQTARFFRINQTATNSTTWSIQELGVWRITSLCDGVTCTASDQCHVAGICDPGTGVCSNPNANNGTTCTDGNACTTGEACQNGTCTGGTAVTCTTDQCHNIGACVPATGCPTPTNKPNGTGCNDANACTTGEACQNGTCTGGTAVTCTTDQCHDIGACVPATGCPAPTNKPDGTMCSDGNGCTYNDICLTGVCFGPDQITCPAPAPCLLDGTCNPSTGFCSWPTAPNGTSCDDFDACTSGSACQNGTCAGGTTVTCTTDQCHDIGACDPGPGCPAPTNKTNGTACSDGNACTQTDTCQAGACTGGNPIVCTASNACHVAGTCNPSTGVCSNPNAPDGTNCNDGNACTYNDTCLNGICFDPYPITCPSPAPCLLDGTCNPSTGFCSWPIAPNGTSCDDFDACTSGSACQNGTCAGGTTVTCTTDQCHDIGACDPGPGCPAPTNKTNGTACSDGNACTQTDTCQAGACTGANAMVCTASDACHAAGVCDPVTGTCSNPALGGSCSLGAFDYDKAGRLIRDRGAELRYDAYDELREVLPTASPPPITNLPVEDLELPGELTASAGRANSKGHVPVAVVVESGGTHTLLFRGNGSPEDLNTTLGMSTILVGNAMNDAGAVAGSFLTEEFTSHAFRYDQAGFHDLGSPAEAAFDINAANQVVGVFNTGGSTRGYIHTDATGFREIGTLGGASSWARTIDDLGVVAASAQVPGTPSTGFALYGHAALYDDILQLQDLNDLLDPMSGVTLVTANEKRGDWVVGGELVGGVQRAYRMRLSMAAVEEIGWAGLSNAVSVNAAGDTVGWGYVDAGNTQVAAWILSERTGFAKLNDLIDPASGWNLTIPSKIDDFGVVVGSGFHNGRPSAFRLRIPAHSSGTGGPMVAEVHTYGYDGQRTSTTTGPGTPTASTQFWITQDYSEHEGVRDHYLRVGNRIVAKLTLRPPPGGGGGGMGVLVDPRHPPINLGDLVAKILLALLLAGGLAAMVGSALGRKRRPAWVVATTGPTLLFFVASCEMLGTNRQSAETVWERIETVYFHQGVAAGPVLTTNADGTLREERRYEPFGQPIDSKVADTIGPVDFRREQQNSLGKLTNPNTGWSYHGARWMQPQTARWTAPDPAVKGPDRSHLLIPWDLNPYAYVRQNPSIYWDPDGALSWLLEDLGKSGDDPPADVKEKSGRWSTSVRFVVQPGDTRENIANRLAIPEDKIMVEDTEGDVVANKVQVTPGDKITILAPPAHLRMAANALGHVGSTAWKMQCDVYGCNRQVIAAAKQSGLRSPGWNAGRFGNPRFHHPQFPKLQADSGGRGQRLGPNIAGEINAWDHPTGHASGHVVTNLGANIGVIDMRGGHFIYYPSNPTGLVVNPGTNDVSIQSLADKVTHRGEAPTLSRLPVDDK